MSIVNISIEQNYNQIFVKKKDLPSFEKEHSCAFERILGSYFKNKGFKFEQINDECYVKYFLAQDPIRF